MRDAILAALDAVAAQSSVRILHACESGSRAWGFASTDSDWDVRFLYAQDLEWYLRVGRGADTIERMLPGDLDLVGWELRKALGLFDRSNVPLYEHLGSDIRYVEDGGVAARLRALIPAYFNPIAAGFHYLSLARNVHAQHLGGESVNVKKLFYVLRPLAALRWIARHGTMPPTRFDAVLDGIEPSPTQRAWIAELQARKVAAREGDATGLDPAIRAWIDGWLAEGPEIAQALPRRGAVRDRALDRVLADCVLRR